MMKTKEIYSLYKKSYCVVIDTRKVKSDCLFYGFKGEKVNGNSFAKQAIENGALAAFVDDKQYEDPSNQIYFVESSLDSIQKLAKYHRKKLRIPFIGITGSNGKTTTKELMAAVLNEKYKVLFTEGNLNNHLGVPLTILSIDLSYEMAIIEMGANHQGEIAALSKISRPDIGYITNFGKAHLEGFGGEEGVIKGKSELYDFLKKHHKTILVNQADKLQNKKTKNYPKKITFGKPKSEYYFELVAGNSDYLELKYKEMLFRTQLTGDYNFPNASAAISLGLKYKVALEKIQSALENYSPENQRSQIIQKGNQKIILDAYNANPSSMLVALENFSTFKGSRTVILGDMFELGKYSSEEHKKTTEEVERFDVDEAIFIGENFYEHKHDKGLFFRNKEEFENYLDHHSIDSDNILIKASRGIALETLLGKLN